ncbi:MAG TPA: hypothetical protein VK542_00900 [Gemmatimonadaceae bacterium]|nr:hypothetical protein [Gemmatimonadaceae bacterium]
MTSTNWNANLVIQGTGAGRATTAPATTQRSNATTGQDPEAAARNLGDVISQRVQRELDAANIKGAIGQGVAGGVQGTLETPPAPDAPQTFTIQGPGGTKVITIPPHAFDNTIPPQVEDISIMFFLTIGAIIIFLPLVRAFARRMDRRGGTAQIPNEVSSQLAHLNQAVDAIALEVERISEGQRFTTRLLSEQRDAARQTLGSGLK